MPPRTKRRATILDVAREAGVAFKTVSRVLNNESNVSLETQKKVRKAIEVLDYSPSIAARVLWCKQLSYFGLLHTHCLHQGAPAAWRGQTPIAWLSRCVENEWD